MIEIFTWKVYIQVIVKRGVKFLEDIIIKNQKEEKIKKQLLAITAIIFLTIIVLYELFYCNFQYFKKKLLKIIANITRATITSTIE